MTPNSNSCNLNQPFCNSTTSATTITIITNLLSLNLVQHQPFLNTKSPPTSKLHLLTTTVRLHLHVEISSAITIFSLLYHGLHPQGPIQSFLESVTSHPCPPVAHTDLLLGLLEFPIIMLNKCSPRRHDLSTTRPSYISG